MTEAKLLHGRKLLNQIENLSAEANMWDSSRNATKIECIIGAVTISYFAEFDKEAWDEFCEKNIKATNEKIETLRKEFEKL